MRIGASGAKGTESRPPRMRRGSFPVRQLSLDIERGVFEFNVGVKAFGMDGRYQLPMRHLQQDLGEPGNSGGRLQMADVRFHRTDGTVLSVCVRSAESLDQSCNFDGITQCGSCAVGFNGTDAGWLNTGPIDRLPYQFRLGIRIRNRIAGCLSPMIDRACLDDPVNGVVV